MNVKDHKEQDMEIREEEDDTVYKIYRTLLKHIQEGNMAYIWHMWYNYVCPKCVPADTDLDQTLTVSNVQPNIKRYAFDYVNIVHMEADDAVVSQKHHLCWYIFDSSWFTDCLQTRPKLPHLIIENMVAPTHSRKKLIHLLLRYV